MDRISKELETQETNSKKDFVPGNYHVYVQKFFKGDADSYVIFEDENGKFYGAPYPSIHYVPKKHEAYLGSVESFGFADDKFIKGFIEKIKADPAVSLEYAIR